MQMLHEPEYLSIATGYGLRGRGSSVGRINNFNFFISPRPVLGSTQILIQWVGGAFSPGVKRQGREAENSTPTSAEIKNTCIYASTPAYVFFA
jgi:hypothetical protein